MTKDRTGETITDMYLGRMCPICSSSFLSKDSNSCGGWSVDYSCNSCGSRFQFNEGDKMGGQFDSITILKHNISKLK